MVDAFIDVPLNADPTELEHYGPRRSVNQAPAERKLHDRSITLGDVHESGRIGAT